MVEQTSDPQSEVEICQALHASRVVPLAVADPHGPLGLEQNEFLIIRPVAEYFFEILFAIASSTN